MSDDPYEGVAGGGLRLKGGKVKKNKKKKKNKAEDIAEKATSTSTSHSSTSQDVKKSVKKTAAELAFEKSQETRAAERIFKKASKTHKQRVEELNEYLGELSEHYDIQKVSWTKYTKKFENIVMFPSSGYFRNAYCPFYQYGLCHRPYCHFKHAKPEKQEPFDASCSRNNVANKKSGKKKTSREKPTSASTTVRTEDKEDDIMEIVKNIPPSKLIEYAKRKEEEKELRHTLELIDKENEQKERISTSEDDQHSGLIDAFYNKTTLIGQFTSDLPHSDKISSLHDITPALNLPGRKICECDDPDCTGFIEVDDNAVRDDGVEEIFVNADEYVGTSKASKRKTKQKKRTLSDLDFFGGEIVGKKKVKKKKSAEKNESHLKQKVKIGSIPDELQLYNDRNAFDLVHAINETNTCNTSRSMDMKTNLCEASVKKDYIDDDCVGTTGHASVKKRTAHSTDEVLRAPIQAKKSRTKLSYVSPGLAAPPSSSQQSASILPTVDATMGFSTEAGVYIGKKRVAHAFVPPVIEKVKRPKLAMEIGAKISHVLRQRYLDKIIDELMPKCKSEGVACEKGFAEEAIACQRSSRKQIYMNLCANIIKRVRSMPDYVPTMESSVDPSITATTTVQVVNRIKSSSLLGYKKVSMEKKAIKRAIKPPSSTLINAASAQKNETATHRRRLSSEAVELNEVNFYHHLKQYLLSDGQLWENKYPRRDVDNPDVTIIKDYTPQISVLKRLCCRCGKEYYMNKKGKYVTREECNYHWGKLRKRKEKGNWSSFFSCCQSDASGQPCSMSRLHVCNMIGPLDHYVSTENCFNEEAKGKVFALDCEMCYTTQGLELTRLTVVGFNLEQLIDLFIKPTNPIVDYNTRFSGVTKEHLEDVTTNLQDIHDILLNMIDKDTILMGHSLESDLKALKMIHTNVVDTALVFPHRLGLPFKRALRTLMAEYLQKIIQDGEAGHDSCEDARACMELMKHKFIEDNKKLCRANNYMPSVSSYSNKS